MTDLAAKDRSPDFSVGLTYAYVDRRTDVDVPNNGQDVLGYQRRNHDSALEDRTRRRGRGRHPDPAGRGAASRRSTIAGSIAARRSLEGRIPEIERRLALLEDVLPIQSEQALASAESAYAAGRVDALALLDAERVLLDVRLTAARSRTDLAIACIDLEAAVGAPAIHRAGGRS